ncbi:hypothetical protein KBC99_03205 [Candidatus Saccharibacteria bacterium]|nr:hypothetical protein [Candidatus Saccharibacteria bacterium]
MSFESLGDVLSRKDFDQSDDLLAFFEMVRSVIKRHSGITIESVSYKNNILRVSVSHPVEASEIRLRHIQITRELAKRSGRVIAKLVTRVI